MKIVGQATALLDARTLEAAVTQSLKKPAAPADSRGEVSRVVPYGERTLSPEPARVADLSPTE
jgi:hypothetical protein